MGKPFKAIVLEPGKLARVEQFDGSLQGMQEFVGGHIEQFSFNDDDVVAVCNDEGKLIGLDLNRGIKDEDGNLFDILVGKVFLAYGPWTSEYYLDMPKELEEKYLELFKYPEIFLRLGREIISIPYNPEE